MSENRYTQAAEQFFGNDDNDASTPSASSDSDTPEVMENETSDWYVSIGHTKAAATGFVKAHPDLSTSFAGKDDDELHVQVRWMKALHEVKTRLGARQKDDNPFGINFGRDDGYAAEFGHELPTIETEEIDPGILTALKAQEGKTDDWEERDTDDLGMGLPLLLPVIDGTTLPVLVQNEGHLEAALELLEQVPDEPGVAEAPEPEMTDFEKAADALGISPEVLDAELEGHPIPGEMNVEEIRELITDLEDKDVVYTMIRVEKEMDNRSTALKALEGRHNRLLEKAEQAKQSAPDNDAAAFFGNDDGEAEAEAETTVVDGSKDVGKATKVKMAMSLHEDDGVPIEEAKEMVGL
ncbi:hypothetical protein HCTV-15_gp101 [Haloarcula virus HCTV-15]|nr:hypothetical protein HCTV-6_gp101 [Haloarcula virus HCTV-6]UBF22575.1 hypothetical protein HCTV-15_gp101 [Haloarcula virus HCTV-15]